jgi:hypothetical protein
MHRVVRFQTVAIGIHMGLEKKKKGVFLSTATKPANGHKTKPYPH